jgi:biotin carboxyl carrier protein
VGTNDGRERHANGEISDSVYQDFKAGPELRGQSQPAGAQRAPATKGQATLQYQNVLPDRLGNATVRGWFVKEGGFVKLNAPLALLETTELGVIEVASPCSGKVTKLYSTADEMIDTGAAMIDIQIDQALGWATVDTSTRACATCRPRQWFRLGDID